MSNNQRNTVLLIAVVILVAGGLVAWKLSHQTKSPTTSNTISATSSTSYPIVASSSAPLVIKPISVPVTKIAGPKPPSLAHTIVFTSDLSPDAQSALLDTVASLKARLQKDSGDLDAWINLGIQYKIASD